MSTAITTAPHPLEAWADRFTALVALLEQAHTELSELSSLPRPDGDDDRRVRILRDLLEVRMKVNRPSYQGVKDRVVAMLARLQAVLNAGAPQMVESILATTLDEIVRLHDAGAEDPDRPVILLSDFGNTALRVPGGVGVEIMLGDPSVLPPKHVGRSLVPEAELYYLGRRGFLVLGDKWRRYFDPQQVAALTRDWRGDQLRQESERAAKEKDEQDRRRRRAEESPEHQIQILAAEVAALKAAQAQGVRA